MHWNYRAIQHDEDFFGLHEVFYDDDTNEPMGATANPIEFGGDSVESIVWSLKRALADLNRSKVMTWDDIGGADDTETQEPNERVHAENS